jgi:hypothetical protein
MRAFLLGCAISLAALDDVSGQYPARLNQDIDSAVTASQAAAATALDTLRRLVNARNFRAMGFDSLAEAGSATLGRPLVIFRVPLGALRAFNPKNDPWRIVRPSEMVFYPVLVGKQARSAIVLRGDGNRWRVATYGGANPARLSSEAIRIADSLLPPPQRQYFWIEVRIPSTNFIGFESTTRLILIPLRDDRMNRWRQGVPIPADSVFGQLSPEARAYNAQPG